MRISPPALPTSAASAAISLVLAGAALQADSNAAMTAIGQVQQSFVHELLLPVAALGGVAAIDKFGLAPRAQRTSDEGDGGVFTGKLSASRILERDAESITLGAPACFLANLVALAALHGTAHVHLACWALDWAAVVPAVVLIRNGQLELGKYAFEDPAEFERCAPQWSAAGTTIFERPSDAMVGTDVVVRQHSDGWRTLRFCGADGSLGSIQSVTRMRDDGYVEPRHVANEYVKSMASIALAALGNRPAAGGSKGPRMLFLGLGAGTLPLLFARHVPEASTLRAVEIDAAVVDAANSALGLGADVINMATPEAEAGADDAADKMTPAQAVEARARAGVATMASGSPRIEVVVGDALDAVANCDPGSYDAIFIDIFNKSVLPMPPPLVIAATALQAAFRAPAPIAALTHAGTTGRPRRSSIATSSATCTAPSHPMASRCTTSTSTRRRRPPTWRRRSLTWRRRCTPIYSPRRAACPSTTKVTPSSHRARRRTGRCVGALLRSSSSRRGARVSSVG